MDPNLLLTWVDSNPRFLYFGLIACALSLVFLRLRENLQQKQKARVSQLKKLRPFEAIAVDAPVKDLHGKVQRKAVESTNARFTFLIKGVIPSLLIFLLFILLLPTLNRAPAIYVSVFLAVFTVVFGSAAKPFIENVIAGLIVAFGRPIRIGDTVKVDDLYCSVERITLTYTVLRIWDWRRYVVPNHKLLSKEIINYTLEDSYHWTHVEFWVSPDSDIDQVEQIAVSAMENAESFSDYQPPAFWLIEMGERGIRCWLAGWADSPASSWSLLHEARMNLARYFKKEGIRLHSLYVNSDLTSSAQNQL